MQWNGSGRTPFTIDASRNTGDLRRGKGDDLHGGVVAKPDVEVVEVPARRSEDQDALALMAPVAHFDPKARREGLSG